MKYLSLLLILFSGICHAQIPTSIFDEHINENGITILNDFSKLLSIPNVAVDLPNINRNADYIKSELEKRGVKAKLLRMVGTPPIVYGYLEGENTDRTLALYVHYDGQPVDKSNWATDPWSPTFKDRNGKTVEMPQSNSEIDPESRLFARSAGDDKGPIIGILTALDAMKDNNIKPTSNLVFFFEGQEEAGSRQLRRYLEDNRDLVDQIDLWMFCDGPVHQSRKPQLVFGVRGTTGIEITVYGPKRSFTFWTLWELGTCTGTDDLLTCRQYERRRWECGNRRFL